VAIGLATTRSWPRVSERASVRAKPTRPSVSGRSALKRMRDVRVEEKRTGTRPLSSRTRRENGVGKIVRLLTTGC
jgi:hypothetical protein